MARENTAWGYDRFQDALANLGLIIAPNSAKKILIWHGMEPAQERKCTTTWSGFIRAHMSILAGADYLTVEVLTLRGSVTYYVLFFIHLESSKVVVSGLTSHPNVRWMKQITRSVTMDEWGFLNNCRYLIHDRDTKYSQSFRDVTESGDGKTLPQPARSPNLNTFSERWVKSVKDE